MSQFIDIYHRVYYLSTNVAVPVIDTPSSSNITVYVGSTVTLSCISRGSPPDSFTWRKDNGLTIESTSITAVDHTSTSAVFHANYSMNNVTTVDSGMYTCSVANPIGSDSEKFTVTVIGMFLTFQHIIFKMLQIFNSITCAYLCSYVMN